MPYYKKLNLENVESISKHILAIIPTELIANSAFRHLDHEQFQNVPLLWEELAKLDLTTGDLLGVSVITCSQGDQVPAHRDGGKAGTALNWPVLGCYGTKTLYYELLDPVHNTSDQRSTPDGGIYYQYTPDQIQLTDTLEWTDQPNLLDVYSIHSVENNVNPKRVTVSLRFTKHILLD